MAGPSPRVKKGRRAAPGSRAWVSPPLPEEGHDVGVVPFWGRKREARGGKHPYRTETVVEGPICMGDMSMGLLKKGDGTISMRRTP